MLEVYHSFSWPVGLSDRLLGHEILEMVRRYVELASDDVAEAHQKASPVDGWRL
jgi:hypothetical protein